GLKALNRHSDIHEIKIFKKVGDSVLVPPSGFESIGWIVTHGQSHYQAQQNLEEIVEGISITVTPYEPISSIGQTKRKNPFSAASVIREHILRSSKIERLRYLPTKPLPKLKVGVLCNIYGGDSEVENDLTKVGNSIKKTLEGRGHKVTFFDMNEDPLPIIKLMRADVDIVFNVCERINDSSYLEPHGASLLDILQIPYTGSNPQTLALCIDKIRVKKLLDYHSIPTPKWDYAFSTEDEIDSSLRYPLMVKPASTDNSIGITNDSVVTTPEQLRQQIERCLKLAPAALIEEYIEGDEYDVTIIGNDDEAIVLPLSRSTFDDLPKNIWHIYPYDAKWHENSVYDLIKVERPALVPAKLAKIISEIALDTYNILDCHDYGRVEIRVDKEGNPFVLELNPNPSIDENDCVPASAELIGQNYGDFLEEVISYAIQRYRNSPPYAHLQASF
ncbi:MAG: ATP-grasp domain-containing protein, partial [Candidatus Komeilibacteria bacterium]|nr:ATP-grasp domain-containing protein [Candidatus Komeilibacteria bacterium]